MRPRRKLRRQARAPRAARGGAAVGREEAQQEVPVPARCDAQRRLPEGGGWNQGEERWVQREEGRWDPREGERWDQRELEEEDWGWGYGVGTGARGPTAASHQRGDEERWRSRIVLGRWEAGRKRTDGCSPPTRDQSSGHSSGEPRRRTRLMASSTAMRRSSSIHVPHSYRPAIATAGWAVEGMGK